jgi:hypothetical protein
MDSIRIMLGLALLCYGGYHLYLLHMSIKRPQDYAALKQREHEVKIAKLNAQQEKKNKIAGGIAGGLAKAILGAFLNKRH